MTKTRWILVAGAVMAAFALPSAVAAAPPATLTIAASKSGEATIDLARPSVVTVDPGFESKQVAIEGNGRIVGVFLQQLGVENGSVLVAASFNGCTAQACKPFFPGEFVNGTGAGPTNADITLPAGRYRVVLFADGAPVKVRLSLTGLAASTTLEPRGPTNGAYHELDDIAEDLSAPASNVYSAGKTYPAGPAAVVLRQAIYRTVAAAASVVGSCLIHGEPPPAGAYAPGCPTGDRTSDREQVIGPVVVLDPSQVELRQYGNVLTRPDQRASIGHYLVSAVPATTSDVLHVHIPLTPPAAATPNAPQPPQPSSAEQQSQVTDDAPAQAGEQLPATGPQVPVAFVAATALALGSITRRWLAGTVA